MSTPSYNAYIKDPATGKMITWTEYITAQMNLAPRHSDRPSRMTPDDLLALYNKTHGVSATQSAEPEYEWYQAYKAHLARQEPSMDKLAKKALRPPPAFHRLGPFPAPEVPSVSEHVPAASDAEGYDDK